MSHFEALFVFALIVSVVFALINKDAFRDQVRYGALVFLAFLGVAFVLGWLMFSVPL